MRMFLLDKICVLYCLGLFFLNAIRVSTDLGRNGSPVMYRLVAGMVYGVPYQGRRDLLSKFLERIREDPTIVHHKLANMQSHQPTTYYLFSY